MYKSTNGSIVGMRTDSVVVDGNDTVYYLLKNLQEVGYDCYHLEGPSWLGEKITIKPDGQTLVYNLNNEPILIRPRATLNESWMCYDSPTLKFRMTVDSVLLSDVLGYADSVKTVSFQALDANGQNINHYINNLKIKLSENYGIVKTLNFFNFPDVYFGFLFTGCSEFSLCGFNSPETGIQNLTWKEVHDYYPGDELHSVYEQSSYSFYERKSTIKKLISRENSADTIMYEWDVKSMDYKISNGNSSLTSSQDTTLQYIYDNQYPNFELLPGVMFQIDLSYFNVSKMHLGIHGISKYMGQMLGSITLPFWIDTCYTPTIDGGSVSAYNYIKGLGGPYYNNVEPMFPSKNELVYYRKDSLEWGTPLDFVVNTRFESIRNSDDCLLVFPNPTSDYLTIEFKNNSDPFTIQIIDFSGKEVVARTLKGEKNILDLSSLPSGLYLIRLSTENRIITKRIIRN